MEVTNLLMLKWGRHPALIALEPVNKPWSNTVSVLDTLKDFYRKTRTLMREINPDIKFVFSDAGLPSHLYWNDLFADDDMENVVIDLYYSMAFDPAWDKVEVYCGYWETMNTGTRIGDIKYEKWFGEWSLGTDVCHMWLEGFNDASTEDQYEC